MTEKEAFNLRKKCFEVLLSIFNITQPDIYAKHKSYQYNLEEEAYLCALNEIPINPENKQERLLYGGGKMKYGK